MVNISGSPDFFEYSPVVAVDRELGKRYMNFEFDYAAFDEEAQRTGLSPRDRAALNIEINKSNISSGSYNHVDKKIRVNIGVVSIVDRPNNVIIHETKHAAQDSEGSLAVDKRMIVGKLGVLGWMAEAPIQSTIWGSYASGRSWAEHLAPKPALAAIAPPAFAFIWGYLLHPQERAASRAVRQSSAKIIKLSKKL